MDTSTFIQLMPKCELHVHLEGTLEPDLLRELHIRNNLPLCPCPSTAPTSTPKYTFHDLTSFLAIYYPAMTCLLTAADFTTLAYAYLQKCAAQNVIHTEMFFDPQAHTSRGVPFPTVIEGYHSAVERARSELGVSASLIMCFLRDMSAASAMATLEEALPYKQWIVGVGLDSDERGNPPSKFAAVFARARREGWRLTCHCDVDQENTLEHIRQCLEDLRVDRLDHGTNIVASPSLVALAKSRNVGLTCCPLSNSFVCADFKGKEIMELLRQGLKVTVNGDDPAYFGGYMVDNMEKMAEGAGASREELVALQRNAFEIAWVDDGLRLGFLERLEAFGREVS